MIEVYSEKGEQLMRLNRVALRFVMREAKCTVTVIAEYAAFLPCPGFFLRPTLKSTFPHTARRSARFDCLTVLRDRPGARAADPAVFRASEPALRKETRTSDRAPPSYEVRLSQRLLSALSVQNKFVSQSVFSATLYPYEPRCADMAQSLRPYNMP